MPQFFYIESKGSPSDQPLALNAQNGGVPYAGQNIILYRHWTGGANEAWELQLTPSSSAHPYPTGHIAAGGDSSLVLGFGPVVDGNQTVVLCAKTSGDDSQLWELRPGGGSGAPHCGVFVNKQNGQALNAAESVASMAQIITFPLNGSVATDNAQWRIVPFAVPMQQATMIQCVAAGLGAGAQVLQVQDSLMTPGTSVVVGARSVATVDQPAWPTNAVWTYSLDGYISSSLHPDLVLSGPPDDMSGNAVVMYPRQTFNNTFQQWVVTATRQEIGGLEFSVLQISNVQNGQLLTLQNGAVVTAAASGDTSQQWVNSAGYPLETILAQPPVPFPTAPAGTPYAESYVYISENVNPPAPMAGGGIRGLYTTVDAGVLSNYITEVAGMSQPSTISDTQAWQAVVVQLTAELEAASTVQGLYAQYGVLHNELKGSAEISVESLSTLIGASLVSNGSSKGILGTVVEGLVIAGINLIPDVGGAVATLLQTGINLATASGGIQVTKYEIAVSALQGEITSTFAALQQASAAQATMVLSDWGKLSAVSRLTALPAWHPWSLNMTQESAAGLATTLGYGSELAILQFLMPAGFQIWRWYQIPNSTPPSSILPSKAPSWAYYVESLQGGVYNLYLLGHGSDPSYPNQETMTRLSQLGVQTYNLFTAAGGWDNFGFSYRDVGDGWVAEDNPARGGWNNILVATIQNCTQYVLEAALAPFHGCHLSVNTKALTVPAYGWVTFAALVGNHNCVSVNVWVEVSGVPVMSFETIGGVSCRATWAPSDSKQFYLTKASMQGVVADANHGPPDMLTVCVGYSSNPLTS